MEAFTWHDFWSDSDDNLCQAAHPKHADGMLDKDSGVVFVNFQNTGQVPNILAQHLQH